MPPENNDFDPLYVLDFRGRSYMQTFEQSRIDNEMLMGMKISPLSFDAQGKIVIERLLT
jgi:hypothetical protein